MTGTARSPAPVPASAHPPCPACGAPVAGDERFCESCGGALEPSVQAGPAPDGVPPDVSVPTAPAGAATPAPRPRTPSRRTGVVVEDADLTLPHAAACTACGGRTAGDGYCEQCGTPATRPRDHWSERPADWVALVCDRGVRHRRNEDAGAVAATSSPREYAALVVCDGVSSSQDSDVASLAAARAARDVLAAVPAPAQVAHAGPGLASRAGGSSAVRARAGELRAAVRAASAAADREATAVAVEPTATDPPSCTFAAAVLEGDLLVTGWVGDSRVYWLPDLPGDRAEQLSVDDSWAAEAIAHGMTRAQAEAGPHAHAITRWLGVDAPDPVARTAARRIDGPGWVLVCSDGLWNYCSDAADLQRLVADGVAAGATDPAALAEELVDWANRQGGQDNITVALARVARADAEGTSDG